MSASSSSSSRPAAAAAAAPSRKRNNNDAHSSHDDMHDNGDDDDDGDDEKDQSFSLTYEARTKQHRVSSETSRDFFVALTDWASSKYAAAWASNNEIFMYCATHKRLTDMFVRQKSASGCKECGATGTDVQTEQEIAVYHKMTYPMIVPCKFGDGDVAIANRIEIMKLYETVNAELIAATRKHAEDTKAGVTSTVDMADVCDRFHKTTVAYIQHAWYASDYIRNQYRMIGALDVDCKRVASNTNNLLDVDNSSQRGFLDQFRSDMLNQRPNGTPYNAVWCKQHLCPGEWLIGPHASRYKDCGFCIKPRNASRSDVEYERRMASFSFSG